MLHCARLCTHQVDLGIAYFEHTKSITVKPTLTCVMSPVFPHRSPLHGVYLSISVEPFIHQPLLVHGLHVACYFLLSGLTDNQGGNETNFTSECTSLAQTWAINAGRVACIGSMAHCPCAVVRLCLRPLLFMSATKYTLLPTVVAMLALHQDYYIEIRVQCMNVS